jgi:hypothetical protein
MKRIIGLVLMSGVMTCGVTKINAQKSSVEDAACIPIIYSTDLFQPPIDPDDHYDLAILASIPELDLKAVIFDMASSQRKIEEAGITALRQISAITNRPTPPWAIGLRHQLISKEDKAMTQPEEFQKGIDLILKTLRESDKKVVLLLVGSCRDFAVAYNREPRLLQQKVAAVYVNAGTGPGGIQTEWNVTLDPFAYLCLLESKLPIYWCPCATRVFKVATPEEVFSGKVFATYFQVNNQAKLLAKSSDMLKNYIGYALNHATEEPLGFLKRIPEALPETGRNMWSTASFLHAAGRKIYEYNHQYIACSPQKAQSMGITDKEIDVFHFENIRLTRISTKSVDDQFGTLDTPQCVFLGCQLDKVGKTDLTPDGHPDYQVRLMGLNTDKKIEKIVINGIQDTRWEYPPTSESWAVAMEQHGRNIDFFFSPRIEGAHWITLYFTDNTQQRVFSNATQIPFVPNFKENLNASKTSVKVFRYVHPQCNTIMVSVLSELLGKL